MSIKELYHEVRDKVGAEEFDRRIKNWLQRLNREVTTRSAASSASAESIAFATAVLKDLNQLTGADYTLLPEYQTMITYWQKQGKTLDDFRKVHKLKFSQWFTDDKMRPYLRPSTLYTKKHFDEYLQESRILAAKKTPPSTQSIKSIPSIDASANHDFLMQRIKLIGDLAKESDPAKRKKLQEDIKALDAKRNKESNK